MKQNRSLSALFALMICTCVLLIACGPKDSRQATPYAGGGEDFSFREIEGLYGIPIDSVPWAGGVQYNPQNAPIAYFFLSPADLSLSAPHIRVEYMSKNLPFCSAPDSVADWLKQHFLVQQRGILVTDKTEIKTYSGKKALFMEIATPDIKADSVMYPGKNMAWAYIEGDTSLIGLNFTSQEKSQYATGLALFKELVQTYDEP